MPTCVFKACRNYGTKVKKKDGVSYHRFPKDELKRQKWLAVIRKQRHEPDWTPSIYSRVCSIHFKPEDTRTTSKGLQKISTGAVPFFHRTFASAATTSSGQVQSVDRQFDDGHDDQENGVPELSCFACGVELSEKIYKCVECEDVTMCGECERDNFHPHHCVLRVPSQTIYNALRSVFASIQRELSEKLSVKGDEGEDPFQLGGAAAADDDEDLQHSDFNSDESSSRQDKVKMETLEIEVPIAKRKVKGKQVPKAKIADDSKFKTTYTADSKVKPSSTKTIKGKVDKIPLSNTTASVQANKKIAVDTLEGKSKVFKIKSEFPANAPSELEIYVPGATTVLTHGTGDPLIIKNEIKVEPEDEEIKRIENPDGNPGPSSFTVIEYGSHKASTKPL